MMSNRSTELTLTLDAGPEADAEELAESTRQLRQELLELEIESVDLVSAGKAPVKAKAGDPISWGALLLTLASSSGVLPNLINVLKSWLTRHEGNSVTLEIGGDKLEVKGLSSEQQQRLVEAWLSRH